MGPGKDPHTYRTPREGPPVTYGGTGGSIKGTDPLEPHTRPGRTPITVR